MIDAHTPWHIACAYVALYTAASCAAICLIDRLRNRPRRNRRR